MNTILIIESNPHLEAIWTLNLRIYMHVEAVCKQLGEFGIKYLEEVETPPLAIITRKDHKSEQTYETIKKFLNKSKFDIPIVVIHPKKMEGLRKKDKQVKNCLDLNTIMKSTSKLVGITAVDMASKVVENYYPIPINFFKNLSYLVCPIYINDIDDPEKYIVKFSSGEKLDSEAISKLIEDGYSNLYVLKFDRLRITNSISEEIIVKLDAGELSTEEKLVYSDKMLGSLGKNLLRQGFDPQSIIQAKNLMDQVKKVSAKEGKLRKLLNSMLSNDASYRFKHVQLITLLGLKVIGKSDWGNDTQEEKFIFAATMHDITLTKDSWAKIHSIKELDNAKLSEKDRNRVLNHANDAANLIQDFPKAPMGVENIILKH
ncbi:MAG: hypothetical protein OEY33_09975, partial [Bdellovibrionales bacterium]|nr:hypothetical protein [Bdellovibrionales bacterium]